MNFYSSFWAWTKFLTSLNSYSNSLCCLNFQWTWCLTAGAINARITKISAILKMVSFMDFLKVFLTIPNCPLLNALLASICCFLKRIVSRREAPIIPTTGGVMPTKLTTLTDPIKMPKSMRMVNTLMLQRTHLSDFLWEASFFFRISLFSFFFDGGLAIGASKG